VGSLRVNTNGSARRWGSEAQEFHPFVTKLKIDCDLRDQSDAAARGQIASAIDALIENREQLSADADLRSVIEHLQSVVDNIRTLAPSVRPFFDALLRQLSDRYTHQKSVLASVVRAGSWWNFDVYYALGSGATEDANLRTREAISSIRVALKNFAQDERYASGLIHSGDSQLARSGSSSRHESRDYRERHPS
jgi:hypothetical protein